MKGVSMVGKVVMVVCLAVSNVYAAEGFLVRSVGTKSSKHISFSAEGFQSVGNQSGTAGLTSVGGGGNGMLGGAVPVGQNISEAILKAVPGVHYGTAGLTSVGGGGLFVPAPARSSIKEDVPKLVPYYTDEEDR